MAKGNGKKSLDEQILEELKALRGDMNRGFDALIERTARSASVQGSKTCRPSRAVRRAL